MTGKPPENDQPSGTACILVTVAELERLVAECNALRTYAAALERNGVAMGLIRQLRIEHGITSEMMDPPGT